jgi:hypothetical protein
MPTDDPRARRIIVKAPADLDPLDIAQALVGPHVLLKAAYQPNWTHRPFRRWKALTGLYARVQAMYEAQLKRMQAEVTRYVDRNITKGPLRKAGGRRQPPIVTPEQLKEIVKIIQDHHAGFMLGIGLEDHFDTEEIERLVKQGVLPPESLDMIDDAFTYGQMTASMAELEDQKKLKTVTYEKFKKLVVETPIPTTADERRAIEWAKHSAAIHMSGIGTKVADDFSTMVISEDATLRRKYMATVRDSVTQGIDERKSWRRIGSDIGHKTGDWGRSMARVAATETQNAFQEAYVEGLIKREGDPDDVLVSKQPSSGACKHCVALHLTAGHGSAPRIFKLSELTANGTNVGRKAAEWKAVVGTVHPWCACEITHLPVGFGFERKPESGEGWTEVPNRKGAWRKPDGEGWEYWQPDMLPDSLRKGYAFHRDLQKSFMTYGDVPDKGCYVDVADPLVRQEVQKVIDSTPQSLFDKEVGVTIVTTDTVRPVNAFNHHDLAYWTGNEVRLAQRLAPEQVEHVLRHELGHSLNVYLIRKMGSEAAVRDWHDGLMLISKQEGFVSNYARTQAIENAAEVTRLYLYERKKLMLEYPRQFTYVYKAYKAVVS